MGATMGATTVASAKGIRFYDTAEDRPLLFAYYTTPFVRPQWNFTASLRSEVQARFSPTMRYRLGLDIGLNIGTEVS